VEKLWLMDDFFDLNGRRISTWGNSRIFFQCTSRYKLGASGYFRSLWHFRWDDLCMDFGGWFYQPVCRNILIQPLLLPETSENRLSSGFGT
jgi:hypothetical protein